MILMVANKHKESVALCIYHFPGVIGFWNCWFSRKGKMGVGKEKPLEEPTTESTQSECFHCYTSLAPYGIHVRKYPVYNKVLDNK